MEFLIPIPQGSLVLRKYYAKLVSVLAQCLNELLVQLVSEEVITIEDKNTIKKFGDSSVDKAEYLIDNHINRPLAVGIVDNLAKLLQVMQKIPSCNSLATELLQALKCDTPPGVANPHPSSTLLRDVKASDEVTSDKSGMFNASPFINRIFTYSYVCSSYLV